MNNYPNYPYMNTNAAAQQARRSSAESLPGLRELFDDRLLPQSPTRTAAAIPPAAAHPGMYYAPAQAQGYMPQQQQVAYPARPQTANPYGVPAQQPSGLVRSPYPAPPVPHQQHQQQQQASQFAVLTPSGRTLATADTYRDMLSAARTARREEGVVPAEDARVCPYCGKVCDRPSTLKTHLNSHTGERPYTCYVQGCGRQFTVLSNMYRHAKTCTVQQQQQQGSGAGAGAGSGYGGQQAYQSGSRR